MANKTIDQLTAKTSPANADELAIWDASGSATKKMTRKNILANVVTAAADATSISIDSDVDELIYQSNTQAVGTLTVNNPTGTPKDAQPLLLRIKSTNAQTFSWGANFRGSTDTPLPTSHTGSSKTNYYAFRYNSIDSKWDFLSVNAGF